MRRLTFLLIWMLSVVSLWGQQEKQRWEEQRKKEREQWEQQNRREWEAWQQRNAAERQLWQDMIDRESAEWKAHVAAVRKLWQDIRFSDVKRWVGYGPNKSSRFEADFDNGKLTIDVLGSPNTSQEILQQQAIEILHQLLNTRAAPDEKPILQDQLPISPTMNQVPAKYVETRSYTAPNGKNFQRMTVNIPFRQNHLRIRAQQVAPFVQRYCQKYNINPKLVMAIIHTESAFNPRAISTFRKSNGGYGHAYGLMQLVPEYGGSEAMEVIGTRGIPSPGILLNPEKNIELGVAYLSKLKWHYFSGVSHALNRQYMMTAAYNTGPFNVARAFVQRKDVNAAVAVVNRMQPANVYNHLLYHLPQAETRSYLQKVTSRMGLY